MKKERKYEPDEVIDTIEIKGEKVLLYQGKRGGKYYYKNGKKTYFKETVAKPKVKTVVKVVDVRKKVEDDEPQTYICRYYQIDPETGDEIDDFKEWTTASSLEEAREHFEDEYWRSIQNGTIRIGDIWKDRK